MDTTARRTTHYLVAYSAVVTLAFILTVYFGFVRPVHATSSITDFDHIRVHRIDIVEPDGTDRLILSNRADYPGSFFHGKEIARPDRSDSAGLLFINDEGTEQGGLIFGGLSTNGKPTSFGHISFDDYQQDQTLSLETSNVEGEKATSLRINDMPNYALTPAVMKQFEHVKAMPQGPARTAAWTAIEKKYPFGYQRASLARHPDRSVGLTLSDPTGHPRLKLLVAPNGDPIIQFLDANGKVTRILSPTP